MPSAISLKCRPRWPEIRKQALPLRRPSQLVQRPIVQFLVAASGGLLGDVSSLLNTAAEMAILDGSERITLALLEQVAHSHA
jgi:hypothetical protein